MLQDIPTSTFRESRGEARHAAAQPHEQRSCVLQTARLTLRPPEPSDVHAIARLANDRRIALNTRRLPHPYTTADAAQFVHALAADPRETAFLIERDGEPIGMVGINRRAPEEWRGPGLADLGYWLGAAHWGQGFGTEAARAMIDHFFQEQNDGVLYAQARVSNPASRNILEKCGFQWTGVELHRFEVLGSSAPVDAFRLTRGVWASLKSWASAARLVG